MNSDQSLMRERLGYALFREMGVTSPRTAPVRLVINGEFAGLFLLVEQIDRSFTRARFGDGGEGNIYKEIWPVHNQQELYATALRNKGGVDRSVERIQRFAQNLLDASENELSTLSERWIHHETIMRYLAVDRTIGNDDGIMHWYCGIPEAQGANASACGNHNFYWYEESKQDHLWLIPWDLDLILGGNTFTLLPAPWYSETNSCEEVVSSFSSRLAWCDPLIRSWTMSMSDFDAVVNDFLEGPFSVGSVETKLATWESQIAPYVEEAFDSNSKHLSVADWQDGLAELRWQIEMHRSRAEMPR
jgi:hypothetical protein